MRSATVSKPYAKGREPMENIFRTFLRPILATKEKGASAADDPITKEIRSVESKLKNVQNRFDQYTDFDMTDACIYEMEALEARYRFLIKKAKEEKAKKAPVFSIGNE